ncbi:MAG: NAD-dependent epimerase/dehydratase family protein [Armatimonadetes bacterium]|nr:NAD-dependent epimerase/dehydratase family protein [Armatimonadota bacterium]
MRVFIIGGTRFMGLRLAQSYSADLHDVTTFTRTGGSGAGHIQGDRREAGALKRAVSESKPDLIVDMMCMTAQDAVDLVDASACPFVVASSCDVYRNFGCAIGTDSADPDPVPLDEDAHLRDSRYPYRGTERAKRDPWIDDYDKILVEEKVLAAGGTVVRLPMVFGPNDYQHRLFEYLRRMDDGRPAILLGRQQARWTSCRGYVDDMAHAIALAGKGAGQGPKLYNAAYETLMTEAEWVAAIGRAVGWTGVVKTVEDAALPEHLKSPTDFSYDVAVSSERIRRELGYAETKPLSEALRITVAWERENPPTQATAPDYAAEDEALAAAGAG